MGDAILETLAAEHRRLDELLGRFLTAAHVGDPEVARERLTRFDEALRLHMAFEEEHLFTDPPGDKLVPAAQESEDARLSRELRLEHVQIRELSGMLRRLLEEKKDLEAALRLFPNLARRWDAHTTKEETAFGRQGGRSA